MCLVSNAKTATVVKELLTQRHIRQRDLATSIGMAEQTLSNKLRGLRLFTLGDIVKIADYFSVSLDSLVAREGEEFVL